MSSTAPPGAILPWRCSSSGLYMVVRVATAASAWADIAVRMRERDPLSSTDEWNPAILCRGCDDCSSSAADSPAGFHHHYACRF